MSEEMEMTIEAPKINIPPWDDLDDGIREAVRTLWLAGWNPKDSGDGSKADFMECAVDYPMIACKEVGSDVEMYLKRGNTILDRMKCLDIVSPGMTVEISYGASGCLVIFADYSKHYKECSVEPNSKQLEFDFTHKGIALKDDFWDLVEKAGPEPTPMATLTPEPDWGED